MAGYKIENGVLLFERDSATVQVRLWPPEAFIRSTGQAEWRACRAANAIKLGDLMDYLTGHQQLLQLFPPENEENRPGDFAALRSAVAEIPKNVLDTVVHFPDHHMALLKLAETGGEPALDLMQTCPALSYAVAAQRHFTRRRRDSGELVLERRAKICRHLGFPGNKSTVRVLTRVCREALNVSLLKSLRDLLNHDQHADWLRHLRRINRMVIVLLSGPFAEYARYEMIEEVSLLTTKASKSLERTCADLHRILDLLGDRPRQKFRSVRQLTRMHDDMVAMLEDFEIPKAGNLAALTLPEPPVPDVETDDVSIVGVRSAAELYRLGRTFKNCVFSYLSRLIAERHRDKPRLFIYTMSKPSKATVEIKLNAETDRYELSAIKGPMNKAPAQRAVEAVLHWLAENGQTGTLSKPVRRAPRVRPESPPDPPRVPEVEPVRQRPPPNIPVEELLGLLEADHPVVRSGALMALPRGLRDDPRVVSALLRRLTGDTSYAIRRLAAERLVEFGDETLIEPMREVGRAVAEEQGELRRAIAVTVTQLEIKRDRR